MLYVRDAGSYVVASARPEGERENPWMLNLMAADQAIRVGRACLSARVELLDELEAERLWPRIVNRWPALDTFYRATGDRWVFRLTA